MGGPMMGMPIASLDVPVLKGTSGILAFTEGRNLRPREYPCIRCGRCLEACPYFLNPSRLARLAKARLYEEMNNYFVMDCVECGSCTYACPSRIPIVQLIRTAKSQLRQPGANPIDEHQGSPASAAGCTPAQAAADHPRRHARRTARPGAGNPGGPLVLRAQRAPGIERMHRRLHSDRMGFHARGTSAGSICSTAAVYSPACCWGSRCRPACRSGSPLSAARSASGWAN